MDVRRVPLLDVVIGAVLVALVAFCALRPEADIDIFWHVTVGRWILDHHALPDRDVWSAADPDAPWQSFEWLYQIAVAWLDRHAGFRGMQLASVAWYAATFGAFFALLRGQRWPRATAACATLVLLVGFHDRLRLRPDACNLAAWLVPTFYVAARVRPRGWHAVAAFVLFACWAAFHRGVAWIAVVFVLATVAAAIAARSVRGRVPSDTVRLAIALAALVGWIAAPGGARALWFVSSQLGGAEGYVEEWQGWSGALSAWPRARVAPHVALALALVPIAWAAWLARSVAWLRAMRVRNERAIAIDALPSLVLAAGYASLATFWFRFAFLAPLSLVLTVPVPKPSRSLALGSMSLAALLAAVELQYAVHPFATLHDAWIARGMPIARSSFPDMVTRVLADSHVEARVATPAGWGGYVLYQGSPRLRVTLDGRMVAPRSVLETTHAIRTVFSQGNAFDTLPELYSRLPADLVVMPHPALPGGQPAGEWIPLLATSTADLLARRSPWLDRYAPALRASIEAHRPQGSPAR